MIKYLTINVYYGVIIDKNDYENFQKKYGFTNFYGKLYESELFFGEVGEVGFSWKQVIGHKIISETTDIISFENNDKYFSLLNDNSQFNLPIETEKDIRNKLLSFGITATPNYHIFCSWETSNV